MIHNEIDMSSIHYARVTASLFLVIFALHLLRLIYGWDAEIAGYAIPMWASWIAMILAGFISAFGFKLAGKG